MEIRTEGRFHAHWDCKYHVIITPKYRKKIQYGPVRKRVGEILRSLSEQKKVAIVEEHAMVDHIHLVMAIPPKYSVASIVGYMKGKSAIRLHQEYSRFYKNYHGKSFWSRGYFVSTVGLDEEMIKNYARNQEKRDKHEDGAHQMDMKW